MTRTDNNRNAYQGEYLLTAHHSVNTDSWATGHNNNVLVLGCSGGGKTRHHLKPNLLQCQGSFVVLDGKGALYREMGPYLKQQGYEVDCLDFTNLGNGIGYNPLDHIRVEDGKPNQTDMIAIAKAICPEESSGVDPFWQQAAANYLTSYIAYVMEAVSPKERSFSTVIRVYESACVDFADSLFERLGRRNPDSYAVALYRRAKSTAGAEKMHSSIMGMLASNLLPFGPDSVREAFDAPSRVCFEKLATEKYALFVTMDDMDRSLSGLTSLFVHQAFTCLCDYADKRCEGGRLPMPVRFLLDDFANLNLPDFDNVLSVIRSREISATIVCQTVSQLEARYGKAAANSIIGNCDTQLVLAFQDAETASYFGLRANRTATALLETPANKWWLFIRGQRAICDNAFQLESHPNYQQLREAQDQKSGLRAEELNEYAEWGDAASAANESLAA